MIYTAAVAAQIFFSAQVQWQKTAVNKDIQKTFSRRPQVDFVWKTDPVVFYKHKCERTAENPYDWTIDIVQEPLTINNLRKEEWIAYKKMRSYATNKTRDFMQDVKRINKISDELLPAEQTKLNELELLQTKWTISTETKEKIEFQRTIISSLQSELEYLKIDDLEKQEYQNDQSGIYAMINPNQEWLIMDSTKIENPQQMIIINEKDQKIYRLPVSTGRKKIIPRDGGFKSIPPGYTTQWMYYIAWSFEATEKFSDTVPVLATDLDATHGVNKKSYKLSSAYYEKQSASMVWTLFYLEDLEWKKDPSRRIWIYLHWSNAVDKIWKKASNGCIRFLTKHRKELKELLVYGVTYQQDSLWNKKSIPNNKRTYMQHHMQKVTWKDVRIDGWTLIYIIGTKELQDIQTKEEH